MKRSGFTLIEILTVIAIIGVLSSLSVGVFSVAQKRNRDSRRKADLHLISQAIDFYYGETRSLPGYPNGCESAQPFTSLERESDETWIPDLTAAHLPANRGKRYTVPRDPLYPKNRTRPEHYYTYVCSQNSGESYTLSTVLENTSDKESDNGRYTVTR